jgi:hypothetical protein
MIEMNEEEKCELLNQYIDALCAEQSTARVEVHDEEEATLRALARLLKVAAPTEAATPSPAFTSALEKRLIRHHQTLYRRQETRPRWTRIPIKPMLLRRAGAVTALATVLLALFLVVVPLVRKPFGPSFSSLPSLAGIAKAYGPLEEWPSLPGVLGDTELELGTSLPASPQRMTLYRQVADPATKKDAADLARRFGVQGDVYRVGASLVAEDEHSRLVIFGAQKGFYHYQELSTSPAPDVSIDVSAAIRLGQRYLQQRALLDFDHGSPLLLAQPEKETASPYRILFPQLVDGITIENAGVTVMVTKGGEVAEIVGRVLRLEPVGQQPILSGEAAYHSLQDPGTRQTIWVEVIDEREGWSLAQMETRQLGAPPSPFSYQPGDYVEIEGVLNTTLLQDASGVISYTRAFLMPETCVSPLRLIGAKVNELAPFDGYRVKISGLISAGDPNRPALIAENHQRTHPQEQAVVLLGLLEVGRAQDEDILLLRSPEGTYYALFQWCHSMPSLLAEYLSGAWPAKVLVRGVLTGDQVADKFPIVRIDQIHTGSEVDELESLTPDVISRLAPRPSVAPASISVLSGQAYIENADLILFAFPLPSDFQDAIVEPYRYLLPAYRFEGRTSDGRAFTIYVQANPTEDQ